MRKEETSINKEVLIGYVLKIKTARKSKFDIGGGGGMEYWLRYKKMLCINKYINMKHTPKETLF